MFTATHTRLFIKSSKTISYLLKQYLISTYQQKGKQWEDFEALPYPSSELIQEVLKSPLQIFFKHAFKIYAQLEKARLFVLYYQEQPELANQLISLEQATYLKPLTIQHIEERQQQLDECVKNSYENYQKEWDTWGTEIINQLKEKGLELSSFEEDEIKDHESVSALFAREIELEITLPRKSIKNISDYLNCKTYLAIYNLLSRQHQQNTQQAIKKITKQLRSFFNDLERKERKLIEEQYKAMQSNIHPIHQIEAVNLNVS